MEIIDQLIMTFSSRDNKIVNYWDIPGFEEVYLEDSFVLGICITIDSAEFLLEIVLTEKHPLFIPSPSTERYCYKKGILTFSKTSNMDIQIRNQNKQVDPDGSIDYGNIDTFDIIEKNQYFLTGCWGELKLTSDHLPLIKII